MKWKKPSQELIKHLNAIQEPYGAQKKTMFGSTVYFANDRMFIGVHEDHIFLRLPEIAKAFIAVHIILSGWVYYVQIFPAMRNDHHHDFVRSRLYG